MNYLITLPAILRVEMQQHSEVLTQRRLIYKREFLIAMNTIQLRRFHQELGSDLFHLTRGNCKPYSKRNVELPPLVVYNPRMKLIDIEADIVSAVSTRANASVRDIAKLVGVREFKCRYILDKLIQRGVIRRRVVINTARVGYQCFAVWFSLPSKLASKENEIISAIKKSDHISYFGEYSGEYDWRIDVMAQSANEADAVLGELTEKFGPIFVNRESACALSIRDYSLKTSAKRLRQSDVLCVDFAAPSVGISAQDHNILREVALEETASQSILARRLRISESTLGFRLRKLQELEIIVGHHMLVAAEQAPNYDIGLYLHRIKISSADKAARKRVQVFSQSDPVVHGLTQMFGDTDVEMLTSSLVPHTPREFEQRLKRELGDLIFSVKTQRALKHHKLNGFPFPSRSV